MSDNIEIFTLDNDIKVFCETPKSFPDGIAKAQQDLHSLVPFSGERRYFGISRPNEKGTVIYQAATEEVYQGEAEEYGFETFIIVSGRYISLIVPDFADDVQQIVKAFQMLSVYPGIDPEGDCIEFYLNERDVRCMVRLIR